MIIVHAGHRIDKSDQTVERFPNRRVGSVYRRLYLHLLDRRPTALVSAAANGADLLALRAAEDLFIPFHVFLPLPDAEFRRRSVEDRGPDWTEAYERAISRAASVTAAEDLGQHEDWYFRGNDHILSHARQRMAELNGSGDQLIEALAVICSDPSAAGSTGDFITKASNQGLNVVTIDPLSD